MMCRRKREPEVESQRALDGARKSLKRVKARDSEVHAVSESLRVLREKNHFAEQLTNMIAYKKGVVNGR